MEYTTTTDLGFKDTFKKWNGKYLTEDSYDTVISSIEYDGDVIKIYKPHGTLMGKTLLACIVKKAYKGKVYQTVKDTLFSIDDTSTMRADAAGPIDHDAMKAKGLIEGKDYVLRTPNSYYPLKKNGEFNRIAEANEIHSVLIGYKRGRFTGMIKASGWMQKKSNAKKLEALSQIANVNEEALKNAVPEVYNLQKTFADNCIDKKYHIGGSPMTALSANKYSTGGTTKMSAHLDGKDLEFGMTTMCVFRIGEFDGAYLCFPRYGIAIEADDGDVLIADSNELHGVTPITGEGVRLSCVAYCDEHVATMGEAGKTEKPIGPHAGNYEEKGTLGDFL
jgi:hypothetical protein